MAAEAQQKDGSAGAKLQWIPDEDVLQCSAAGCGTAFGFFTRRHHCRGCGGVFCAAHTAHTSPVISPILPPDCDITPAEAQKQQDHTVCDNCFAKCCREVRRDPACFSAKTTAEEAGQGYDLTGRVAVVTGGNGGVGFEAARVLALRGASVIIGARNGEKGQNAVRSIVSETRNDRVVFHPLDLGVIASVKAFAAAVLDKSVWKPAATNGGAVEAKKEQQSDAEQAVEQKKQEQNQTDAVGPAVIDMLVLNAGVFGPSVERNPDTGLDQTLAINHFGHFALTKLLMPALRRSKEHTRIVVVSSHSHYQEKTGLDLSFHKQFHQDRDTKAMTPLSGWAAYGVSKLANVLFAKELQRRYGPAGGGAAAAAGGGGGEKEEKGKGKEQEDKASAAMGLDAFALHPGTMIATDIAREATGGSLFMKLISPFTKSVAQGAATTVRCAVDVTLTGKGGDYYSDCQVHAPSDASQDAKAASDLWAWSEELFAQYYTDTGTDDK